MSGECNDGRRVLQAIVDEVLSQNVGPSNLAKQFLGGGVETHRYAIGRNSETLQIHNRVKLNGIIDDFYDESADWEGIPVTSTAHVPSNALIANCSTSISPVSVMQHLTRSGLTNVVGFHELAMASNGVLQWPWFVQAQRKEMAGHIGEWGKIFDSLRDDISRQTLVDVIRFRLSADPKYMTNYRVRLSEQYFEDFMDFNNEVFVDAGGFDGDTSQLFADRYPDFKKIIFFEPSKQNMLAARHRLAQYKNIDYRLLGLSNSSGILQFNHCAGSASSITDSGGDTIKVDTLDATVIEPVSFIKMDLEGWEIKALEGARNHIKMDRPKLAIAVYHDAADFRLVHQFVTGLGQGYNVFLRHYTQGRS